MKYEHKFEVNASLTEVTRFHSLSTSMGAITPPPVIAKIHSAPEVLKEGDEMDFTLWIGPLPIRWLARIEDVTPTGFVDRQLRGPFTSWVHRHTFRQIGPSKTEVIDEVEAITSSNWFWKFVGIGMWLNMPVLFGFRAWKTKRLLRNNEELRSRLATRS